jgi:exopolysaccharide production protein ExoY
VNLASVPVTRQVVPDNEIMWQAVAVGERLLATALLVGTAPVWLTSALLVALLSGRPPFIAHRRVGWCGAALWMLKLRTMWDAAMPRPSQTWQCVEYIDDETGPQRKQADDPRVQNRFARFCRRHSIDEIPQLWHVVRGEMALIGPRPVTRGEIRCHYGDDADELLRVKPGIAGLWQVSGRARLSYSERRKLDLHFVRNRSLKMYVRILWRTVPEVLNGANTW